MYTNRLIGRNVRNHIYCFLFMALLTVGNAFAEDDPVEIDPNSPILGVLSKLWNFLIELVW